MKPVLALLALVPIGASFAAAQSGTPLVQRLEAIAGAGALEAKNAGTVKFQNISTVPASR